jgi:hypothetical protein
MAIRRQLNRRSFLGTVSGGLVASGTLALIGPGRAAAAQTGPYTGVTDNDSGSYADNAGHGRGPGGNRYGQPARPQQGQTGYSDSDSGANADPSGAGRRGRATGVTDSDPSDPYGNGRGALNSGGRVVRSNQRRPDGGCTRYTGYTDSDSGAVRDPASYGNNGSPGSNLLPQVHCR